MISAHCLDCDGRIAFNPSATVGQKVTCPHCDSDLEVISVEPLELDWAYNWPWEDDGQVLTDLLSSPGAVDGNGKDGRA